MNKVTNLKPRTGAARKAAHYHTRIAGSHSHHQNAQVIRYLQELGQPTNARVLHKIMNGKGYTIDLVSLRRCLTNLTKPSPKGQWQNQWGRAMIREAYEKPCPITNVSVGWYELIPNVTQTKLFE